MSDLDQGAKIRHTEEAQNVILWVLIIILSKCLRGLSFFFFEHSISARVITLHRIDQFGSNQKIPAVKTLNPILRFGVDSGTRHQGRQNSVGR